jgi:hypothetical protein
MFNNIDFINTFVNTTHWLIIKVIERGVIASKLVLPKEGKVTRRSKLEYAQALRPRYYKASKEEKGKMLDEFTKVTSLHRKAAIRLLNRVCHSTTCKRCGRKRKYGSEVVAVLKEVWEASDRLCSKRLQPFIPEMVKALRRHGEQHINGSLEMQLCLMIPSTIDRLLRSYRKLGRRKSFSTTRPGSLLKRAIPIRTFADWKEDQPGFMETDLVAHCGDNVDGFYLNTLCAVDIASGGQNVSRYGVNGKKRCVNQYIGWNNIYPSSYLVSILTMGANSSTKASITITVMR